MSRIEVENLKNISTYKFKEWGFFKDSNCILRTNKITWSRNGEKYSSVGMELNYNKGLPVNLKLIYQSTETQENYESIINIFNTPCNYGKNRFWFECPRCYRRSAKLYFYECLLYCRVCLNLTYESNNRSKSYRYMDKVLGPIFEEERGESNYRKYYAGKPTKKYQKKLSKNIDINDYENYINSFRFRGRPKSSKLY